jgi:hypothetical protein
MTTVSEVTKSVAQVENEQVKAVSKVRVRKNSEYLGNLLGLSLTECVTDYELPRQANSLSRK